jgi:hypothetical protein
MAAKQEPRLACIRIAAEARSRIGMYDADRVVADAQIYHDWVTEKTQRETAKDPGGAFPEHAGMNRSLRISSTQVDSIPRTRGDGSTG